MGSSRYQLLCVRTHFVIICASARNCSWRNAHDHPAAHLRLPPRPALRVPRHRGDLPRRAARDPPRRRPSSTGTSGTAPCPSSARPPRPPRWRSSPAPTPRATRPPHGAPRARRSSASTPPTHYLFTVPMWNARVPYILKQFIDVISQPGMIFGFDPVTGYTGLLENKRAAVIYTGAVYGPDRGRLRQRLPAAVLRGLAALGRRRRHPSIASGPTWPPPTPSPAGRSPARGPRPRQAVLNAQNLGWTQ